MPQAVQADWNLIRELYTQGLSLDAIVEQTGVKKGTIACRANRGAWKRIASAATAIVQTARQPRPITQAQDTHTLEQTSTMARKRTAKAITEALSVLPTPGDWKQAAKLQSQLEPLVRNAKTIFGWDNDSAVPSVRINILASCTVTPPADEKHPFPVSTAPDATAQPLLPGGGAIETPSKNFPILDISSKAVEASGVEGHVDVSSAEEPLSSDNTAGLGGS